MNLYKHIVLAYRNTYIAYQKQCVHAKLLEKIKFVTVVFLNNLNRLPCVCGCHETDSINHDYMDHILCEYDIVCKECRQWLGHYAYGGHNIIETYTELWLTIIDEKIDIITWYLCRRFRKQCDHIIGWSKSTKGDNK